MPANNVLLAFVAGLISTLLLHHAKTLGYDVQPDVSNALPGAIALIVAHVYDVISGNNKK